MTRWPMIMTVALVAAFAIYFSWFSIGRHWKINSGRFDLGNVEQVVWNVSHGHGFTMTDPYGTAQVSRLAFHADVFLFGLVPFYLVAPHTETLLMLQVLAVVSGAIATYLIGREIFGRDWWGTLFAVMYLFNPGLQWATIFDFHAVTFAAPLVLWAVWFVLNKRYWWALVFVVLAMTTKEEIGLSLWAIGIYVWYWQRQRRWGGWLMGVPLLWSLTMLFVVLPMFQAQSAATGEVYRSVFGTGAGNILLGILKHPLTFVHALLAHQNLVYAWHLSTATGWLGLAGLWWLGAAPEYIINALSLKPAQHLIISHYTSGVTPWLIVSVIIGTWWIVRELSRRVRNTIVESATAVWLIGWLAYAVWATGPLPHTPNDQTKFATWNNPYAQTVRTWANNIPSSAAVSATNNVGAQFARREHLYSFPLGSAEADYIVVLEGHATPVVATQAEVTEAMGKLLSDPKWVIVQRQGDLTILKRKG